MEPISIKLAGLTSADRRIERDDVRRLLEVAHGMEEGQGSVPLAALLAGADGGVEGDNVTSNPGKRLEAPAKS